MGEDSLERIEGGGVLHEGDIAAIAQELEIDAQGLEQTLGGKRLTTHCMQLLLSPIFTALPVEWLSIPRPRYWMSPAKSSLAYMLPAK